MTQTALTEFDEIVAQMVARKIPRHMAEAAARQHLGIQPVSELEKIRLEAELEQIEDDVVEESDRMMRALGFTVVRFSQKRRSKVTEGIPDRRYYHTRRRLVLWFEAKSATGQQRTSQREFQILCDAVGDPYVLGGLEQLRAWLTDHQVATFDATGLPHPIPYENA